VLIFGRKDQARRGIVLTGYFSERCPASPLRLGSGPAQGRFQGRTAWATAPHEQSGHRSLLVFGDVLRERGGCYREWRVLGRVNTGTERGSTLMAKAGKLKILYGESNAEAQAVTAVAFEKAGHMVEKALGRKAVEGALSKGGFDLVILGPTLSRNDRHHLPYAVKKVQAEISVLVMHADGSRHPYVDACTDTGASVENVLARIEGMKIAGMMPMAAGAAAGR